MCPQHMILKLTADDHIEISETRKNRDLKSVGPSISDFSYTKGSLREKKRSWCNALAIVILYFLQRVQIMKSACEKVTLE